MADIHIDIVENKIEVTLKKEPQILFEILGKGQKGDKIELQKSATHIQWRYAGDISWTNLVLLLDLKGDDGLSVELQNTGTYIQWRSTGGAWQNIISIASLTPDISTKVDKVTGYSLVANTEIAKIHSASSDAETAGSIIALGIDELEFSLINSFLR